MAEQKDTYETDKLTIEHRLTLLEASLNDILTNHLPSIEKKVTWAIAILVTTLIGVVTTLIGTIITRI